MTEQDSTRGGRLKQAAKIVQGDIRRRLVVSIGIDDYQHIPKLNNAVADATGVYKFFTEQLGFEAPAPPILNADATKGEVEDLLETRLPREVGEEDAIVFYFAGHGKARRGSGRGYLALVDAKRDGWRGHIRITNFLGMLDDLRARHVFVILDACHSGRALDEAIIHTRGGEPPAFARELQRQQSRHVLTSARGVQEAWDSGGPLEGHSLFTGYLIHGLISGEADKDSDGVIMTSELSQYVRSLVAKDTDGGQTPDFGAFSRRHKRGELFFPSLTAVTPDKPPAAFAQPTADPPPAGVSPLQHVLALRQMLQDEGMAEYARQQLRNMAQGNDPLVAEAAQVALRTVQKPP